MSVETVHLLSRTALAQGTEAFHLQKPAGFAFRPGQALDIILPGGPEGDDGRHAFSIVSAPHENELVFATRMRDSAYKRALAALAPGAALQLDGPFGSLTLHKTIERPAVLIAGGIGITPFMSMLRDADAHPRGQQLLLLYSNRRPEDSAFLPELQALAARNPQLRLLATMTDMAHSGQPWDGPTGQIDSAFITQALQGLAAPIGYVSGPPGLVQAMRAQLQQAGVDEDDIRSEEFYGY
ncbi:hypothetical protein MASR1M59_14300 [Melaminivora sp.]